MTLPLFRPRPPVLHAVAHAAWMAVTLLAAGAATAQTPPTAPATPPTPPVQTVVITGQAQATDRALRDQAAADNVVSVVRADGIGRLPDKNAAEALQRLPGVSIERDQGEGRYVRIRGLGPDLNAVTLNGALVPAPEAGRRAVALDVLPSSLVRSLVVTKTLTPDMDAHSLGGTVDVQTLSAFDHAGRFMSLEGGFNRETNTDRTSPNATLAWSDVFLDGRLGVALGLSHEQRKFGSHNVETGGAWDGDALEAFERRDYRITRERTGLALNLEFKPEAGTLYSLRGLVSRFSDDEQRQSHVIEFDEAQEAGATGEAAATRELKARVETQTIRSLALGMDRRFGDWRWQAGLGFSESREDSPQGIAAAVFEAEDNFADVGFTNTRQPRLTGPAALNEAGPYALSEIELERSLAVDREHHLRLDLTRSLVLGGVETDLKFGAKMSRRTKTNAQTTWVVEDLGQPLAGLSAGLVDYRPGVFGPAINAGAVRSLVAGSDLDDALDDEESTINDLRIEEDIDAGYLQGRFDLGATSVLAGLRMERTRLRASGTGLRDGDFVPVTAQRSQTHWLPGLHLRHDLDAATSLRAAWTNAVVRPTFDQLSPGFVIDGDEAEFGNPNLKALKSANLDLGIERQLGYAGAVSAYAFHKRIRHFVYRTDVAGSGDWADFDEALTYANGDKARVSGIELAWSRAWRDLPGAWGGLVTSANATFSNSKARIAANDDGAPVGRDIPLPSQSSRVFNVMVGYETPSFGVRLAANHKSRYLLEVSDPLDAQGDLYVDAQTQFDLSARVALSRQLSLVVEALNLGDEPYYVYAARSHRNAQFETYGRSYRIALKLAMF